MGLRVTQANKPTSFLRPQSTSITWVSASWNQLAGDSVGDIQSHGVLFSPNLHRSQLNLLLLTSQSTLNNDYILISETYIP